ncbi:hypothetical protein [Flavobacterium sp. IMCC34518]|uniref:hypothetical protein n=1 Tax=Flavobacterium sp. IMCC34518 TaxID=3003623 RepID=UPI0022AC1050|nr:hypothetical protein [Flavobacterium sp. IMCC34518]
MVRNPYFKDIPLKHNVFKLSFVFSRQDAKVQSLETISSRLCVFARALFLKSMVRNPYFKDISLKHNVFKLSFVFSLQDAKAQSLETISSRLRDFAKALFLKSMVKNPYFKEIPLKHNVFKLSFVFSLQDAKAQSLETISSRLRVFASLREPYF